MRCAVFCCLGLGDGLITLVLSHNLVQSGHQVDTFHPFLGEMQELFPKTPLLPRGDISFGDLEKYDRLFIVYEKSEWMLALLDLALSRFREKTTVLNPIATPLKDYPYWEEGGFDGTLPFVENITFFCKKKLGIKNPTRENGISLPSYIMKGKYPKRVALHPTSSREGKNWSRLKFHRFAKKLSANGFSPVFILTKEEQKQWPEVKAPIFANLIELTCFLAESGFMVGNDSGIGHLASCVGLPTLIICRSQMAADFWRPAWTPGEVIFPPKWIPNLKGMRLRDKKWQYFVPEKKVYDTFSHLVQTSILGD